jgi:osmotically-inducible protein OsmY
MPSKRSKDNQDQPRSMMGRVFGGENFAGEGGPVDWLPSDQDLIQSINEKFTHHPVLDGNSIVVICHDGMVTLRGSVRSHEASALAVGLARSVEGVRNVHNEIMIRGPRVA